MTTTAIQPMTPKFKNVRFKKDGAFEAWLQKHTSIEVEFQDQMQDFLKCWVHSSGEILHANLQSGIWNGKFVNIEALEEGQPIQLWDKDKKEWRGMGRLIIDNIITKQVSG